MTFVTSSLKVSILGLSKERFRTYIIRMCEKSYSQTLDENTIFLCGECHSEMPGGRGWCQSCGEPTAALLDRVLRYLPGPLVIENQIIFPITKSTLNPT